MYRINEYLKKFDLVIGWCQEAGSKFELNKYKLSPQSSLLNTIQQKNWFPKIGPAAVNQTRISRLAVWQAETIGKIFVKLV